MPLLRLLDASVAEGGYALVAIRAAVTPPRSSMRQPRRWRVELLPAGEIPNGGIGRLRKA